MKTSNKYKKILAVALVTVLVFSLSSCKKKTGGETVSDSTTTTVYASASETDSQAETAQPTEQTTQTTQATTQFTETTQTTVAQSESQTQEITEAVVYTGVETLTDGNKTVVYPAAIKNSQYKYPVIAWANGTGCPTQLYKKLIDALANGGYIVVADSSVMTADGSAQINSIDYIISKSTDSSSVFFNKVDTNAIGVSGQSQGGRSCINAAQKDARIRCIVSIAGASSAKEAQGLKIPCFFITGTSDNVVVSSQWCKPSYDAVAGRAAYASIIGGTHLSFSTHTGIIAEYSLAWFNAYLKNDSASKKVFENGGQLSKDTAWQDFQNKN